MSKEMPLELYVHASSESRAPFGIGLKREAAIKELMVAYSVDYRTASIAWNFGVEMDKRRVDK